MSLLCSSDSYYIISLKLIKSPIEEQSNSEKLWIMELWKYKCQELMTRSNFKNYQIIKILGSYFLMKKDCVSFCYYSYGLVEYLNSMWLYKTVNNKITPYCHCIRLRITSSSISKQSVFFSQNISIQVQKKNISIHQFLIIILF